jgi:hypothetical protein
MRISAQTMVTTGVDAAQAALTVLAGGGWVMNLPLWQAACRGHASGSDGPGLLGGEPEPVVVLFGDPAPSAGAGTVLPVRWESMRPGNGLTVLLDGDITLAPATEQADSTLTLTGRCPLPPCILTVDGHEHPLTPLIEAARAFLGDVAASMN